VKSAGFICWKLCPKDLPSVLDRQFISILIQNCQRVAVSAVSLQAGLKCQIWRRTLVLFIKASSFAGE
jgi:hypothetical protein